MKRFVVWIVVLLLFDVLACQSVRAMMQPVWLQEDEPTPLPECNYVEPAAAAQCDVQKHHEESVGTLRNLALTPLPTCQAVFDPAKTGGCGRRGG